MAKYIIEIPDEHESDYIAETPFGKRLFFPLRITDVTYSLPTHLQVEEYTDDNREEIENEVWGFASHLINVSPSVTEDIYWSMNGGKGIGVAVEMTYQEAKARYDSWKQEKEDETIKQKVIDLADDIGIHKLYSLVVDIKGE